MAIIITTRNSGGAVLGSDRAPQINSPIIAPSSKTATAEMVTGVAYVAPLLGMVAYAAGLAGTQGAGAAVPFLLLYALVGGAVIVGVVYAMAQRLREIDGGEEDEASKY